MPSLTENLRQEPPPEVPTSPEAPADAPPDLGPPVAAAEEPANGEKDEDGDEGEEDEAGEEEEEAVQNPHSPLPHNTDVDNSSGFLTLEDAQRLFDSGCASLRSEDYEQACDSLSRALEIRACHFGELAFECAFTYYKYGCALLYKYQAESDALKDPASLKTGQEHEGSKGDQEDEAVEEDLEEEEESDLDLSWKMLDIARAIFEKQTCHSIQEVDVITALADVSLEREDFEMCFRDYTRALEILEGLVEPDNRRIAELFFKLSLAHQLGYKPKDALRHCQQAVTLCETRLQRLKNQVEVTKGTADLKGKSISGSSLLESSQPTGEKKDPLLSNAIENPGCAEQGEEIKEIEQLLEELRDKVTELEEMAVAPSLLDTLKATNPDAVSSIQQVFNVTAKLASGDNHHVSSSHGESSSGGFDAPSVAASSAPVTHLGIVGRGVKRAAPLRVQSSTELGNGLSIKKRSLDDMLTRGGSGETQIGFGSAATTENVHSVNGQPVNPPPGIDDTTQGKS